MTAFDYKIYPMATSTSKDTKKKEKKTTATKTGAKSTSKKSNSKTRKTTKSTKATKSATNKAPKSTEPTKKTTTITEQPTDASVPPQSSEFVIKPTDDEVSQANREKVTSLWLNEDIEKEVSTINNQSPDDTAKVMSAGTVGTVASTSKSQETKDNTQTPVSEETSNKKQQSDNTQNHSDSTSAPTDEPVDLNKPILNSTETKVDATKKETDKTSNEKAAESSGAVVNLSNNPPKDPTEKKFNKKLLILLGLAIFALIGVLVYEYYIKANDYITPYPEEQKQEEQVDNATPNTSRDYENPINGVYFSNEEAAKFKDKKPIAIMVNNFEQARPSYGLSKADVIYEAVAEGGITRLMPIYHSQIPELVESVRSARYYFAELASGYKAHYFHWGGAHVPACQKLPHDNPNYCPPVNGKVETNPKVDAYDRIVELGLPNLDGGNYACTDDAPSCAFGRDTERIKQGYPIEHTGFVRVPLALELAKEIRPDASWHKYVPIVEWKFKDDAPIEERGDIGIDPMISYYYWQTPAAFAVDWKYDKDQNNYIRYQGKVKQVDAANGEELRAKVIVIRFTEQSPVGDKKNHLYHKIVGSGDALVFQDGKVIKGKWTRGTHEDRDVYTDENGNQIAFNRGQIWIQLVPTGNPITYEPKQPSLEIKDDTGKQTETTNEANNSQNSEPAQKEAQQN